MRASILRAFVQVAVIPAFRKMANNEVVFKEKVRVYGDDLCTIALDEVLP